MSVEVEKEKELDGEVRHEAGEEGRREVQGGGLVVGQKGTKELQMLQEKLNQVKNGDEEMSREKKDDEKRILEMKQLCCINSRLLD